MSALHLGISGKKLLLLSVCHFFPRMSTMKWIYKDGKEKIKPVLLLVGKKDRKLH